jgi:chromatin modification-related protein VID21
MMCRSITRSRKRKLRELFAVATAADGLPNFSLEHPDTPPASAPEAKFLDASDILQYVCPSRNHHLDTSTSRRCRVAQLLALSPLVTDTTHRGRKLNELNIPPRPKLRPNAFKQSMPNGPAVPVAVKSTAPPPAQVTGDTPKALKPAPTATERPATVPTLDARKVPAAVPQAKTDTPSTARANDLTSATATQRPHPAVVPDGKAPTAPHAAGRQDIQSPTQTKVGQNGKFADLAKTTPAGHSPPTPKVPATKTSPSTPVPQPVRHEAGAQKLMQQAGPQVAAEPDRMDVDELMAEVPRVNGNLSLTVPQDTTRPVEALSSPSSTAQTATTPAVLETPTNTSPDRDGLQTEEKTGETQQQDKAPRSQTPVDSVSASLSTSKEVEAQLLRDSAVAANSRPASTPLAPLITKPAGQLTVLQVVPPPNASLAPAPASTDKVQPTASPSEQKAQPPSAPLDKVSQPTNSANKVDSPEKTIRSRPGQPEPVNTQKLPGAARQKSVSEVLSGEPLAGSSTVRPMDADSRSLIPITPTSQSPRPRGRSLTERNKLREKSRLSGVIFGKQPQKGPDSGKSIIHGRSKSAGQLPADDYFTPLFIQGFSNGSKWMKPLDQVLHHSHKTISTADAYMHVHEHQACKVLKRVYQHQQHDRWSLRQPKRCPEPTRQTGHWDVLLQEMKWMRTDFRQERKWKSAVARNLAYACAEWTLEPSQRSALQVNAIIPSYPPRACWDDGDLIFHRDATTVNGDEANGPESHPTPDLISSADTDSALDHDDDHPETLLDTAPPSAIFTLEDHEVIFGLNPSPHTDRLLDELPLYGAPLKVPERDALTPKQDPDARWKREAVPLSKFVEGRMELVSDEPPRKRSRYRFAQEDEDEEILFELPDSVPRLDPENPDVALFKNENKPMRDRLHAGHQFRPPNEHSMPFQTFYESRSCSQWTVSEDDELKSLVREYSYNWSLISNMLSTKSVFAAGAERRTPWECFERWVMLEGLPHDMQKTQYFKLWQNRIDTAQAIIRQQNANALTQQAQQQQQQQQQQQSGSSGPVTPLVRRRLSLPVKVERRRNQKHLTMIDAMRKLAKKRETALQKQQHAANLAQMRKQQEQPQPRAGPIKTPREYSIMRWERDQAMAERLAERMAQHQQQRLEAQRRVRPITTKPAPSSNANPQSQATLQARAQQGQAAQMANGQHAQMPPSAANVNTAAHQLTPGVPRANATANQMAVNGQARPRMPMQGTPNGNAAQGHIAGGLVPPLQMNGNGQVQMPVVNGQARMTMPAQPDINLVLQAQRISEQQRQAVQMRQAQQQAHTPQQGSPALQNSPPAAAAVRAAVANGVNQKNYMNNAQAQAIMASFNGAANSGLSTPPAAAGLNMPTGQSASPRPNATMTPQIHQTFVSQLQHIESQIRQTHPNTPQDVVRQMATQLLHNRHNITQAALNAAAGGQGQAAIANGPHQYAQLLRAQQQAQAQAAANAQAQQQVQQQHQRASSGGSATPPVPTMPK